MKRFVKRTIIGALTLVYVGGIARAQTAQPYSADSTALPYDGQAVQPKVVRIKPGQSGMIKVYRAKRAGVYHPHIYNSAARLLQPYRVRVVNPYTTERVRSLVRVKKSELIRRTPVLQRVTKVSDALNRAKAIQQQLSGSSALYGQPVKIQ